MYTMLFTVVCVVGFLGGAQCGKDDTPHHSQTRQCGPHLWSSPEGRKHMNKARPSDVVARFSNIMASDFLSMVNLGRPFIVEDGLAGLNLNHSFAVEVWTARFPTAEYHDWQQGRNSLSNFRRMAQSPDTVHSACVGGYIQTGDHWPANQAYIGIWEQEIHDILPYFYKKWSKLEWNQRDIVFFLGTPGSGVTPHLDETCQTHMSMQLAGTKQWTLSTVSEDQNGRLYWTQPAQVTLQPGEVLVWASNWLHSTQVLENTSLSATVTFDVPTAFHHHQQTHVQLFEHHRNDLEKVYSSWGRGSHKFLRQCCQQAHQFRQVQEELHMMAGKNRMKQDL